MKLMKILMVALVLPILAAARVVVTEGTVKMGKEKMQGFTATYDTSKAAIIDAMENALGEAKLVRSARKKGFIIYRGQVWQQISANTADYYYKVKRKKGVTVLSFVAKENGKFITTLSDARTAGNINVMLQRLGSVNKYGKSVIGGNANQFLDKNSAPVPGSPVKKEGNATPPSLNNQRARQPVYDVK